MNTDKAYGLLNAIRVAYRFNIAIAPTMDAMGFVNSMTSIMPDIKEALYREEAGYLDYTPSKTENDLRKHIAFLQDELAKSKQCEEAAVNMMRKHLASEVADYVMQIGSIMDQLEAKLKITKNIRKSQ